MTELLTKEEYETDTVLINKKTITNAMLEEYDKDVNIDCYLSDEELETACRAVIKAFNRAVELDIKIIVDGTNYPFLGEIFVRAIKEKYGAKDAQISNVLFKKVTFNEYLQFIDFDKVNFYFCHFTGNYIKCCSFLNVIFESCYFDSSNISYCVFNETNFSKTSIFNGLISKSKIYKTGFSRCIVSRTGISHSKIRNVEVREGVYNIFPTNTVASKIDIKCDAFGLTNLCPEGEFIGYKKAISADNSFNSVLVKLLIPADAKRSNSTNLKCRCSKAKVLELTRIHCPEIPCEKAISSYNKDFEYRIGETVEADCFDPDRWQTCSNGIHFFIDKEMALNYKL